MPNPRGQHARSQPTLAILAGGEGRRMGRPKAELQLHGRPILHVLLDQFAWPGPTLLVTAPGREHPPGWDRFTREVTDPRPGEGPLRGLLTALEHAPSDPLVLTAVDMPGVRPEHLHWLVEALKQRGGVCGLLIDRDSRVEPFPSVFRAEAVDIVRRRFAAGERSMHALLKENSIASVTPPEAWPPGVWKNLNRPEDLDA